MPSSAFSNPHLAADLIGFSAGLVITALLLVLSLKAAKLPGTPSGVIPIAICMLAWNGGGLVHSILQALGMRKEEGSALLAAAIQFSGAAACPIPILAIWRHLAVVRWQRNGFRVLLLLAILSAAMIVVSLWCGALGVKVLLPSITLMEFTAFHASILLVSGAVMLLRGDQTSRSLWFASMATLFGVFIAGFATMVRKSFDLSDNLDVALAVVSKQSVLFIVLGAFFLLARFRFADLLIRYSIRIVLATIAAVALVLIIDAPFVSQIASLTAAPGASRFFVASILTSLLLLSFGFLDRSSVTFVNRWIFRAPDYRETVRQLGEQLRVLHLESDVIAATETTCRKTLELEDVRSIAFSRLPATLWPTEIHDGDIFEVSGADPLRRLLSMPDVELLVPVRAGGQVPYILAVSPGRDRRGLVTDEVNCLRSFAAQFGLRLDAFRMEREVVERQSREALLLQQVTEAELRALRAQINPHFLFNSLNTIANLIMTNQSRAETMTLRLAKVFRYVLARSSHPLTSIREEMEFLRTYLEIEEARFGERLRVEIDVAPEVASDDIPSLILQPVVENALKHGLGPKLGAGHLWISARARGNQVCLTVEDDGLGPSLDSTTRMNGTQWPAQVAAKGRNSLGVGLTNVAQRLTTLYRGRAKFSLEVREAGGTRVTLLVPRGELHVYEKSHN